MRKLLIGLFSLTFASVAGATSPEGVWLTEGGTAQVEISRCGEAYCGRTVWLENPNDDDGEPLRDTNNPDAELQDRELVGLQILWDMEPAPRRDNRWEGGRVYDPQNGNTYRARMDLEDENTLSLRGYVGTPMFGRTSTWTREEAVRELSE